MFDNVYLTEEEAAEYCEMAPVSMSQIAFASAMIDAYIGTNHGKSMFSVGTGSATLKFTRKGVAKIKDTPLISIDKAYMIAQSPFGTSEIEIPVHTLQFDESGFIYAPKHIAANTNYRNVGVTGYSGIRIEYTYGYEEVPEQIKLACAMIAINIQQKGTFTNLDSMTTLDSRFALSSPEIVTSEIKMLLQEYKR